jgi:polyphosphate kinase 2 (PPK2 family)
LRNRQHWDLYRGAVDDMLTLTNTDIAPWTVVESNDKRYARVKTLRTVISAMEKVL